MQQRNICWLETIFVSTVGMLINYNNQKTNLGQFGGELLSVHSIFSLFSLLGMSGRKKFFCDPFITKSSVKTAEPHYFRKIVSLQAQVPFLSVVKV